MLRCLAADQRTVRLYAALSHTGNDRCDLLRIVLAACNIIQEKQRFTARTCNIVDTHRNSIDSDCIMLVHE